MYTAKEIEAKQMPELIARAIHLRPNKMGGYKINCLSRVYADIDTDGTYYFQSVQWACRHNNRIDFLPEGFKHDTFHRILNSQR